jgi:predicted SAM-dependent methyltransferase
MHLHIGGVERKSGWSIFNINPGPGVDFVGDCADLTGVSDASCGEVYASHVLEHLGYNDGVPRALASIFRVLESGGRLRLSVPDLDVLCKLWRQPDLKPRERYEVMRMIYGGRTDAHDVHYAGFNFDILAGYLTNAGFERIEQVKAHGLFKDTSTFAFLGRPISLNVTACKPR